ncbi:MAG: hypothetical protein COV55_02305 [Candidatus Komeilibacteria bacterium CG11_big_fil_rev_8_21_14_0_20_36_20]|uniref:Fibronectin type-III domain-containing protein n=2 Tax=Patescibacteria group TaxID=1783273 RepID=A0A2H0ND15_9BACT|nr:MAG: hypothetical protein COV55_02305 [Candidatus Komeilibacteria bacterium CG11_big_fil_rev_8_21_14_0_20_36_20]PIR81806.1 MAG: hypothetical protein COU21_01365 [Candidatus Komeilibacteria bacterium CG10_big_fil_rev_8_21_14_0_10_36_65]PJC55296.1 MAG: hypothetical protein CO027_02700 [Candidatus Komeilibacteria bacterium CG_4_9_14_0_2_um_filter_36_13]
MDSNKIKAKLAAKQKIKQSMFAGGLIMIITLLAAGSISMAVMLHSSPNKTPLRTTITCSNRAPITSACLCNGEEKTSGYCCYYDPDNENIAWQPLGEECGYTKWSPHFQNVLLGRDVRGYKYSNQQTVQEELDWFAGHYDEVLQTEYLDPIESRNPTISHSHYTTLKDVSQYTLDRYNGLEQFASSRDDGLEDAFLHFSENTVLNLYEMDGSFKEQIEITGCPGTPTAECRLDAYDWNTRRWFLNPTSPLAQDYMSDEINTILTTPTAEGNEIERIFIDEFLAMPNGCIYAGGQTRIVSGGGILEYGGRTWDEVDGCHNSVGDYDHDIYQYLAELKSRLPEGKSLIGNPAEYYYTDESLYLAEAVDGEFLEFAFLKPLVSEPWVQRLLDSTQQLIDNNKTVIMSTQVRGSSRRPWGDPCGPFGYCPDGYNPGNYDSSLSRLEIYEAALYYLAKDEENTLAYFDVLSLYADAPYRDTHIEALEVDPGKPIGNYYIYQTNPTIYAREFTKSLVLLNPPGGSYSSGVTVNLNDDFHLLQADGAVNINTINAIHLNNSEAAILLKENPLIYLACSEQGGNYCNQGEECTGEFVNSNEGQLCCINGSCIPGTPPANVTDLEVTDTAYTTVTLNWTAPGDNGNSGTAEEYDIRYYYNHPITPNNWDIATQATGEPEPSVAGTLETFSISNLLPQKHYYFAIKTRDGALLWSGLSNVPDTTTGDAPPFELKLDFDNTDRSNTMTGFTSFPLQVYNANLGYGWENTSGMMPRYRGEYPADNNIFQDMHLPTDGRSSNTFLVDLDPGTYEITLYSGDALAGQKEYDVYAEEIFQKHISQGTAQYITETFTVDVIDGQLNLFFNGTVTGTWGAFNALEINSVGEGGTPPEDNPPSINLLTPNNNYSSNNTSVRFSANIIDDHQLKRATLIIDGSPKISSYSGKNGDYATTITFCSGTHTWSVEACDSINQCAQSETRTFRIVAQEPTWSTEGFSQ